MGQKNIWRHSVSNFETIQYIYGHEKFKETKQKKKKKPKAHHNIIKFSAIKKERTVHFKYQMTAWSFLLEGIGKGAAKILKLIVFYF